MIESSDTGGLKQRARLSLRRIILPIFARINPGDITIKHHYTGAPLRLHSFRHKGYWYFGAQREAETMRLFQRILSPGDVVYEVGGHIGYITQLFADLVRPGGEVTVFEPGVNNLPYLRLNTGSFEHVTIVASGVGAQAGTATFYMESLTGQNNSFVKDFAGLAGNASAAGLKAGVTTTEVPMTTLDAMIGGGARPPDLVKIDVEGYELEVLRGSDRLLSEVHPILMVEVQTDPLEMRKIAARYGYAVTDVQLERYDWSVGNATNTFWFHQSKHAPILESLKRAQSSP